MGDRKYYILMSFFIKPCVSREPQMAIWPIQINSFSNNSKASLNTPLDTLDSPGYDVKLIRCCPEYDVKLIWRQQRMIFCE